MKIIQKLALIFSVFTLMIISQTSFAAEVAPGQSFDGLLELIEASSQNWFSILEGYAKTLFMGLALITVVLTFFPLLFKGADFAELFGEVLKFTLTICFFYALLIYSAEWAQAVVDSFRDAGAHAIGKSERLGPSTVFTMGIDLASLIGSATTWNPLEGMMIALSALLVLVSFVFIAGFIAVAVIEAIIVINAAVLFMGFGGSPHTREYAMAMPRYAVSVGAKLFVITLIVGLIDQAAFDWKQAYDHSQASMWTLVGLSLICAILAKTIPDIVQGLISGTSHSGGGVIGSTATQAVAGMAALATGAAAAGMALSKLADTANASNGGDNSLSSLSKSLDSSLQGGGNPYGDTPAAMSAHDPSNPSGGSGGANAMSVGSVTGGNSSSPNSNNDNSTQQPSEKSAPQKAAEQVDQKKNSDESKSEKGSSNAEAAHQIANAAIKGLGIATAMGVPGAEGAASISLPDAPQAGSSDKDQAASENLGSDENIIRPAEQKTDSISSMQVPGMNKDD